MWLQVRRFNSKQAFLIDVSILGTVPESIGQLKLKRHAGEAILVRV